MFTNNTLNASPIWCKCKPPNTSSHQMELLRTFERSCLRNAANIRRQRHSFKHVRIKKIYYGANINPFDRSVVDRSIPFVEKCKNSNNPKINGFTRNTHTGVYKRIDYFHVLAGSNQLYENGQLLTFHRSYRGDKLVYNPGQ